MRMKIATMFFVFALAGSVFAINAESVEESNATTPVLHDDLLEKLVGKWEANGIVHGAQSRQVLEGEWILNHQFLRISEKSVENVAGKNFPFEAVYYFGYDHVAKHYVVHLLSVWGADSDTLGIGERRGNEINVSFRYVEGSITNRFVWEGDAKGWHIMIQDGKAEKSPYVDLHATATLVNH